MQYVPIHHFVLCILCSITQTVALERCCGVATVLAIFQGEQRPSQSQWPAAMLTLDDLNVRILPSNLFKLYPRIYGPALDDVKTICQLQLGIAYMRDFRTRAKKSNYFSNVLVEPPEPTCSMLAPPRQPSPDPTTVHQVPLQIYSPSTSTFGRPASALSHESTTTFDQLASQMSTMSMCEDIPSAPPPSVCRPSCTSTRHSDGTSSRRQQDTPSPSKKAELPSLALEFLNSLHYGQAKISDVLLVYNYIGRQGQEAALLDFGINRAVAKALVYLLDCE
jgi:hypothetical protein